MNSVKPTRSVNSTAPDTTDGGRRGGGHRDRTRTDPLTVRTEISPSSPCGTSIVDAAVTAGIAPAGGSPRGTHTSTFPDTVSTDASTVRVDADLAAHGPHPDVVARHLDGAGDALHLDLAGAVDLDPAARVHDPTGPEALVDLDAGGLRAQVCGCDRLDPDRTARGRDPGRTEVTVELARVPEALPTTTSVPTGHRTSTSADDAVMTTSTIVGGRRGLRSPARSSRRCRRAASAGDRDPSGVRGHAHPRPSGSHQRVVGHDPDAPTSTRPCAAKRRPSRPEALAAPRPT